jgi:hypothetical protein
MVAATKMAARRQEADELHPYGSDPGAAGDSTRAAAADDVLAERGNRQWPRGKRRQFAHVPIASSYPVRHVTSALVTAA